MRNRTVIAVLTSATLALGLGLPAFAAPGEPRAELPGAASDRARQALSDVRALFDDGARTAARGPAGSGPDATLALRDLMRVRSELTGAERREADGYLARPTDFAADPDGHGYQAGTTPQQTCDVNVCVHWVETTADAPSLRDTDANTIPDFVDTTLETLSSVHSSYVEAGYRAPKPDGSVGGDARTDIYLADIGPQGLYGYCTSDELLPSNRFDAWAYCVLDNDYAADEFPTGTPTHNMRVTAAHEYFHAVQFAYDAFEDSWFMEATATWAEDELFTDINDNLQYLPAGPLAQPRIPLDWFGGSHQYGDWIFFRYLSERFPTAAGGMPTIVRNIWRRADAIPGAADAHSLLAVSQELASRNASLGRVFAQFADANRRSRTTYDEGAANRYPSAPLTWTPITLSPTRNGTTWGSVRLDHLTSASARFVPSRAMTANTWQLKVEVNMAPKTRGSQAVVTVYKRGGGTSTSLLTLNGLGDGAKRVPFDHDRVSAVELTVVNASARTACWQDPTSPFSCLGVPRDDALTQRIRGLATR
jgi:hypothetical protein